MRRVEKKLFRLNDEIVALAEAQRLAEEELSFHRHLNDDAQRDAAVTNAPLDRSDARETAGDVARFEAHIEKLRKSRAKLEKQRARLLEKLG